MLIKINGRDVSTAKTHMTYEDIADWARYFNKETRVDALYTIAWRIGLPRKQDGFLVPGGSTSIEEGMVFNAFITGAA